MKKIDWVRRVFMMGMLLTILPGISTAFATEITIVTEEHPPLAYTENGRVTGMLVEMIQAMLHDMDMACDITVYPWARAYYMGLNEENVLIFPLGKTKEREPLFQWIGELAKRNIYLVKLKTRSDIVIQTLEDAKHYVVGAVREDLKLQYLVQQGFDIQEVVTNDVQNIKKLHAQRIDLVPFNELSFYYLVRQQGFDPDEFEFVYYFEELSQSGPYVAFSRATPKATVEKFRKALEEIKQSGVHQKILEKYLGKNKAD